MIRDGDVLMQKKPNIILINCDDLGYGDLGCYGSEVNRTPAIDKMADNGIRFTDFYMASPVCSPSRGAMMTGCYPPRIGFGTFEGKVVLFPGQGVGLNPKEKTIASVLKDAGYRTMLVGKWHCGDQLEFLPTRHGFDHYYGLPYSNDMGRQSGSRHGFPPLPLLLDDEVIQQQPDQAALTERYTEQAVRFIREKGDSPFFLYMAHMHVHLPLYAAEHFMKNSLNGPYGACVEAVDWSVSVILDELNRQGISDDTLIIFTSDNGSTGRYNGSNHPLRGRKGSTWEGGQRVPCIMCWPGRIKPGRICDEIVSSIDFYPTLAKVAEANISDDRIIDGIDISGLLFNEEPSPRKTFFYYLRNDLEAVRYENWKLHVKKNGEDICLLFDLVNDIGETTDVKEKHPEIANKLEGYIKECADDIGDEQAGIKGKNIRPAGVVLDPKPLTEYDPDHPYIIAMYDKEEAG